MNTLNAIKHYLSEIEPDVGETNGKRRKKQNKRTEETRKQTRETREANGRNERNKREMPLITRSKGSKNWCKHKCAIF